MGKVSRGLLLLSLWGCAGQAQPPDQPPASAPAKNQREPDVASRAAKEPGPNTPEVAPEAAPEAPLVEKSAPEPLPQGTKVLHVGDSFAGALGIPLGKKLEERGVRSILKTKDASYLTDWAWDGKLQTYVWKFNPDLVLVTLGGNELGIVAPEERAKTVRKVVSMLEGRPCVWIAIPLWNGPQNGLLDVIRQNVGPCLYLDTNGLMDTTHMPRVKDGVHPTPEARLAWAELVLAWLGDHRRPTAERVWTLVP
jgi:hypothetical protein